MNNFTVNNVNDDGSGSLRQAIADANNTPGSDHIQFAQELKGQEISLTSGELQISDSVTISGGHANITINSNQSSRIFSVDDLDPANQAEVNIERLTLTGGSSNEGGGAFANSENLTISRRRTISL